MDIDVRTAVERAKEFLNEVGDLIGEGIRDVRLEEVELSEDSQTWLVTLSYGRPVPSPMSINTGFYDTYEREYKQFRVSAKTGEISNMSVRRFSDGVEKYWVSLG
ncbi:MAG: hypothetical protein SFW36_03005 [Leptolyngbyaceae cyanobacterium bins.59]|nr:hypothetical protein [Leptolyngbyaceae cyanobacterium bins.59]